MTRNVGERWEEYLRLGRRMSPHTVSAYLGDLHSLMEFLSLDAARPPEQLREALTQRAVRSWLARTLADGGARSTIARHTAAIRNFTSWAMREGILVSDPAALLSSPRADQLLPSPLDESDARVLLNTARDEAAAGGASQIRNWAILELTYACGLRVSEVCALDISSLNREALTVRIVGKGNKERVVPYGPPAADALDHWLYEAVPSWPGSAAGTPSSSAIRVVALIRASCGRWYTRRRLAQACTTSRHTGCAIPRRRTCCRAEPTCVRSRRCSVTPRCRPLSATPTWIPLV